MDIELGQARKTFITESRELLVEMESALLVLEKSPEDPDNINSLFRAVHTIKGSSGIVDIESVEKFAHVVENLLSRVREKEMSINGDIIELMLKCRDHIEVLVDLAESETRDIPQQVIKVGDALLARLNVLLDSGQSAVVESSAPYHAAVGEPSTGKLSSTDAWHISLRFGPDVLRSGMDPMSFIGYLSKLGDIIGITTIFDSMPIYEQMDAESCYLGFEIEFKSDHDKKTIEDVFEFVREDCKIHVLAPHSRVESYIELIKSLPEDSVLLGDILVKGGILVQSELDEILKLQSAEVELEEGDELKHKNKIGELLVDSGMVHHEVVDAALEKQKEAIKHRSKEASTIRIDAARLDALVNMVGELVISNANLRQQVGRLKDDELNETASLMQRLVEDVRDTTMKLRMVPIGETFSRFNRVVRDISRDLGKEIVLRISGGDTELDKTVVEKINDPLMHLVRNAADHGLESPQARIDAGKPAAGTVRLNAYHDAGSIVIEVSDDGRGLNRNKILNKAVSNGLIAEGQALSDAEMYMLIFEPGFSTADAVTKVSGRGVGMDVVKRNIEQLRGMVSVDSAEGEGMTVRIRLPLTLAIIDGFMVAVAGSIYIIPLEMVVECVDLPEEERRAGNRKSYINLRNEVLPYVRLREFFEEDGRFEGFESIVIVQYAGQKIGLVVDHLHGEVQTVIKSLGRVYKNVEGVSGATIMGDGRVALILDVPHLITLAEEHEKSLTV